MKFKVGDRVRARSMNKLINILGISFIPWAYILLSTWDFANGIR